MHLFVNNLTNVDFSYLDGQRGIVGETWLASITLEGALDDQGMVCDFGIVKKTVRQWLDQYIDHCLLVPLQATALRIQSDAEATHLDWAYGGNQQIHCESPHQAISGIEGKEITPESVSAWCIDKLRSLLPDTIDQIQLRFVPEVIPHHFYHYSHGLKKHNGNCQRIAHGHRSTLEIIQNQQRNHELEQQWCERWRDIYIGTRQDLVEVRKQGGEDIYHFAYQAPQGDFVLTIPASHCDLIDTESTVEFIAQHIAKTLKQEHPDSEFTVRAYEGIGKGAVAFA